VEGRSTVEDRRLRNSYHRVCYVFVEQAASECHWSWTAMGDGQRPTEGDSRLRGKREPVHQATDGPSCTVVRRCCDDTASSAPTTSVPTPLDITQNSSSVQFSLCAANWVLSRVHTVRVTHRNARRSSGPRAATDIA